MWIKSLGLAVLSRWSAAGRDVLASTVAGALAWFIAQTTFGHPHPVFASIIAIVCLAPGLPSHARQALGLLVGVGIGIVVGELALTVPNDIPLLRGTVSVFIAMMIASSFGLGPVVPIQAGVSTILVFVLGPETAGYVRMMDSAVGIAVALFFSQLLLTPDPVGMVEKPARRLLQELSSGFSQCAAALARSDRTIARAAVKRFSTSHDSLIALNASIDWAQGAVRWSLRGRLAARDVDDVVARYDRRGIKLYASTLMFGEELAGALRQAGVPPPAGLCERVQAIAVLCGSAAAGKTIKQTDWMLPAVAEPVRQEWQACIGYLHVAEDALRAFA